MEARKFPQTRLRRLRSREGLRRLARETKVTPEDLVAPLFVCPGRGIRREIPSLPGCYHLSVEEVVREAEGLYALGIPAVLLFGIPERKDPNGSEAASPQGVVQQACRALKAALPELVVMTDVCLCEYTSHGHCGLIQEGQVDNDRTLTVLAEVALSHAEAGADVVAPSDMMDGRVGAIRAALEEHGFPNVVIMAYAAKYASAFYGPFRDAVQSAPQFGDRRSYQMDPANSEEALQEVALDLAEGADIVMVKPALAYLDVIRRVKAEFRVPVAAYNVSGEYAMIKAAAARGWLEEERARAEVLTAIKRAGADIIITYFARDFAAGIRTNRSD